MRPQKFRGNVFVANLPKGYTDEDLAQAFDPYGIVIAAFLARDPATGETKRHGLVSLAPDRAAAAAVEALNGTEINGQRIEARIADPNMALTIPTPPRDGRPDYARRSERNDYARRPERSEYARRPAPADDGDYAPRAPRAPRASFQVEYRSLPVGYRRH